MERCYGTADMEAPHGEVDDTEGRHGERETLWIDDEERSCGEVANDVCREHALHRIPERVSSELQRLCSETIGAMKPTGGNYI